MTCNEGKAASEKRAGELQALKPKTLFGHLTRYYEFKIIVINGRTVFFDHILIAVESSRLSRNKIGDDPAFDKTQRLELDDEHAMVKKLERTTGLTTGLTTGKYNGVCSLVKGVFSLP
jgi:hypothetical protein